MGQRLLQQTLMILLCVTKAILRNGLSPKIRTKVVNGVGDPLVQKNAPYDLLIANILALPSHWYVR